MLDRPTSLLCMSVPFCTISFPSISVAHVFVAVWARFRHTRRTVIRICALSTMASGNLSAKSHNRFFLFCTYRERSPIGRRITELGDIELMSIEVPQDLHRQYVKVNGDEDFDSQWLFVDNDDVKLLALRMKTISGTKMYRYYAFEEVQKSSQGHTCWVCQHSCVDEDKKDQDIRTYALHYIDNIDQLPTQTYHIELTVASSLPSTPQ